MLIPISICIYLFNWSCEASYIGRTIRPVCYRTAEHHLSCLSKGQIRVVKTSVLSHLVDTGSQVDLNKYFKVIYYMPSNLLSGLRVFLLNGVHFHKLNFCIQKKFVHPLSLPRPLVWEWDFRRTLIGHFPSKIFKLFSNFFHIIFLNVLNIHQWILRSLLIYWHFIKIFC